MKETQSLNEVISNFTSDEPEVVMSNLVFKQSVFGRINLIIDIMVKEAIEEMSYDDDALFHVFSNYFNNEHFIQHIGMSSEIESSEFAEYLSIIIGLCEDVGDRFTDFQAKYLAWRFIIIYNLIKTMKNYSQNGSPDSTMDDFIQFGGGRRYESTSRLSSNVTPKK